MAAAAKTHIASGADILTGSSQSVVGSIGAAKDKGAVLWFGTQADQAALAADLVVASQVYDWTGMLKEIIAKREAGTLGGTQYVLTLANGGLKIAYNPGYKLPEAVKAAGDKAIADITSGVIKVNP
jgi:basic membrane protein A